MIYLFIFIFFETFYWVLYSKYDILLIKLAGIKVVETNKNELVFEPMVRWAGNPDITLVANLLSLKITLQVRRACKPYLNCNRVLGI